MSHRPIPRAAFAAVVLAAHATSISACSTGPAGERLSYAPTPRATPEALSECSPAPALFTRALCVCEDLTHAGPLRTVAADGGRADVGIEGRATFAAGTRIDGSFWISDEVTFAGGAEVRDSLWTGGDLTFAGTASCGGDLAVARNVTGAGTLEVGGATHLGGAMLVAGASPALDGAYVEPASAPCGCDEPFDVAGAVAAAATANDNAAIGLSEDLIAVGDHEIVLPSGRYYVRAPIAAGTFSIRAEGNVQLFVEGSLTRAGSSNVEVTAGSTLDLFVSGMIVEAGEAHLGDPDDPSAFRLYIGGTGSASVAAGDRVFDGSIYAPEAEVVFAGETIVRGSVFARSVTYAGSLELHSSALVPAEGCEAPTPDAPDEPADPAPDPGSPDLI